MALYHKWDVKNGFAFVLQFFSLISDGLGGVKHFIRKHFQLTPLMIAAYDGDLNFFQQARKKTFDPNQTLKKSVTSPIHLAAYGGNIELYRQLLQESDNKNNYGKHAITPLHYSAGMGHLEVFKLFHANAEVKNPKMTQRRREATPLHIAADLGHLEICKFIIKKEGDKNPADSNGGTPLHAAAHKVY